MMDFHCHLDLYPDARSVYAKAQQQMDFVWLVTTSPRAYVATSKVLPQTKSITVSPGLHPEVADQKAAELELLLVQIADSPAVGEVGLDGSARYRHSFDLQKRIFTAIVERSASLGGRVLSIHSRAAAKEVLDTLEQFPGFGTAVLHWFTDSVMLLRRADNLGCWFSVGPAMLNTANGRKIAAAIPRDRIVAESDGPFAKTDGKTVMPWEASNISSAMAGIWGMQTSTASDILINNGRELLSKIQKLQR
ncbi:Qat anti-phage system TatD family nuclease QatD [Janthinobacterium sp. GB1R12]|uniref:Qat anti-phage system TatD family nuclease QatD n=1 Tax=Janthinobacterium sp. GB1R12 TaxID=3424190 RepID=UPI003F24823C